VVVHVAGERIEGTHVLVATGRLPNTERLNLEAVGVETDARGFVPVNGRLETSVPGIWALGDINKRGAFTHTSYHDHEIVLANHDGGNRTADDRAMCYAMFTDPPFARVGMSESEARASGKRVLMARFDMKNVSRAKEESETAGLVKLLVDAQTDRFLGFAMVGISADEIVHVFTNYMAAGGTATVMKETLPVHPTVAEFLPTILGKLKPLA
jgi:pyruvate/2-oxoglutarate dehydrogenase complex dihydrolipoamide dehydrogenase (E3) component